MPKFHAKVTGAEQVWKSPDGNRTIFEVVLQVGAATTTAKTYSDKIAKVGFEGELESYEKAGKFGAETYVKQPQKEYTPGGGGGFKGGSKGGGDPFTMYLSYAKDLAVAMLDKTGKLDEDAYGKALETVLTGGKTLYEARPDAPKPEPLPEEPKDDEPHHEPIDHVNLNDLFPE